MVTTQFELPFHRRYDVAEGLEETFLESMTL
jgi:hypothetical protein